MTEHEALSLALVWAIVCTPLGIVYVIDLVKQRRLDRDRTTGPPAAIFPVVEASADQRTAALHLRGLYVALTATGFTETQALALLSGFIAANTGGESS